MLCCLVCGREWLGGRKGERLGMRGKGVRLCYCLFCVFMHFIYTYVFISLASMFACFFIKKKLGKDKS